MPSKVVVTVTNDLNQDQRMHRICNSMVDAGHEVVLVGRAKRKSKSLLSQKFYQKRLSCFFESGVLFYFEYNIRLFFFLLSEKFDLGYSVDLDTISAVAIVCRLRSKRHIHDAHEYFTEVPELADKNVKKWIWNRVAKTFLPLCDLRFTVNKELALVLSEQYKQPFEVLRSVPLLVESTKASQESTDKIILYQGVLNKGRGLEEAIRAIAMMNENVQLLIAGEGDLSHELRMLKKNIDTENKITFLGWKLPEELKEITKTAWLGLNLLDGDSLNYKYSLANKFFDYMHAGVPSLNMDFPVYRRYCDTLNVGCCISDLNKESITKTIVSLLNDSNVYSTISSAAIEASKSHCWQKEERVLLDQISKLSNV